MNTADLIKPTVVPLSKRVYKTQSYFVMVNRLSRYYLTACKRFHFQVVRFCKNYLFRQNLHLVPIGIALISSYHAGRSEI